MGTRLQLSGSLNLETDKPITLAELEKFCAAARELGLQGNAVLITTRQELMGPVTNWHFLIPVIPKPCDA